MLDEIKAKIAVQGAGVQNSFDIPVSASNKQEMRDDNKGAVSGEGNMQVTVNSPQDYTKYMLMSILGAMVFMLYRSKRDKV